MFSAAEYITSHLPRPDRHFCVANPFKTQFKTFTFTQYQRLAQASERYHIFLLVSCNPKSDE